MVLPVKFRILIGNPPENVHIEAVRGAKLLTLPTRDLVRKEPNSSSDLAQSWEFDVRVWGATGCDWYLLRLFFVLDTFLRC
jgi:hypothetical protein